MLGKTPFKFKMNKKFRVFYILLAVSIISSCAGKTPATIGKFSDCPDKPNCVSTKSINKKVYIDPIKYTGSRDDAKRLLISAILSYGSSKIQKDQDAFVHVEFVSEIFGFVDDVEFYFSKPGIIDFRSASRIGYSDLGINRNRMESIRKKFNDLVDAEM